MNPPTTTGHPPGVNVEVQLARMEGKIDQVLIDHDRRITEHAASIGAVNETQTLIGQMLATNTANIDTLKSDVAELRTTHENDVKDINIRMSGTLQKAMSVASPLLAVGSLILAYTMYMNGA